MTDVTLNKIRNTNAGRIPELTAHKYKLMRGDKYHFFRATAALFFEDIPKNSFLFKAPNTWICGDLHLENFGSYKGSNGRPYFNINDFDEAILGSCLLDVVRMICSIYMAVDNLGVGTKDAEHLASLFIDSYFAKLKEGYIHDLEKDTTEGIVKKFLEAVKKRKQAAFIKERTHILDNKKLLRIDNKHTTALSSTVKKEIEKAMHSWAVQFENPEFYTLKDCAFRIAGMSSLGLKRYVVLVKGSKETGGNTLLDIKETRVSCVKKYVKVKQPVWPSEAARIVEVQKRIQYNPPALLNSIDINAVNFVIRELQPTADKIDYRLLDLKPKKLSSVVQHMANVCAWGNLRSAGRQHSAIADTLIAFADQHKFIKTELLDYAHRYSKKMHDEYLAFSQGYDNGFFS